MIAPEADSPSANPEQARPQQYFDFRRVAEGNGLFEGIQRLRYEVYCHECHFLDPGGFPDGLERDEYDQYSVHIGGTNSRGEVVATLRLVRDSPLGFPLERHARELWPLFREINREKSAEISRLIIAKAYRRRANDGLYGENLGGQSRSSYPLILFGLFRQMYEESVNMGLERWLAAMEPTLQHHLNRFGLGLREIGPPMEYYGEVIPYYSRIRDLEEFVANSRPDVFSFFT